MARIPKKSSLYPRNIPKHSTIVIIIKIAKDKYGSEAA